MIYSIWNPMLGNYDYYEGPEPTLNRSLPARISGIAPEDAAYALPRTAQHVGRGPVAKGVVAERKGAFASLGEWEDHFKWIGLAVAGWLLWRASR